MCSSAHHDDFEYFGNYERRDDDDFQHFGNYFTNFDDFEYFRNYERRDGDDDDSTADSIDIIFFFRSWNVRIIPAITRRGDFVRAYGVGADYGTEEALDRDVICYRSG